MCARALERRQIGESKIAASGYFSEEKVYVVHYSRRSAGATTEMALPTTKIT